MPPAGSPYASPYSAQRNPLPRVNDVDNDKQSTMSQSSGVPRAEQALDALQIVAGNRVRHARCAPEFLEEIATKGVQDSLKKSPHRRFKIVHGSEARTYFKNYIRDHGTESEHSRNDNDKITNEIMPSPIVFAVTVWEGSIKCVDYYMTWRGKMKTRRGTEFERRATFLDSEFRRLAKGLDKEYKAISSLRNHGNLSKGTRKYENKPSHSSSRKSHGPPGITISTPEDSSPVLDATQPPLPEPPVSATDSVMSLPLLNMIRGVPFSHRVPLRVANPDRLSIISDTSLLPEEVKDAFSAHNTSSNIPNNLGVPPLSRSTKDDHASDKSIKDSSASIRSSDTKSSKSSSSSRSTSSSENYDYSRHTPGDQGDDYGRRSTREIPKFLIVLLGDKLETDTTSWHGLERQTSVKSLPADRHSPWIIPIVRSESSHRYSTTNTANDSDSDESDTEVWKNTPVIPMKPLMEAMGIIPNSTYYHTAPVVPGGLQYHLSVANATSPSHSHSPYLYGSPRQDPSSFSPAWHSPAQIPSNPPSRPASRAYSSAPYASPYASPYMQSHTGPF